MKKLISCCMCIIMAIIFIPTSHVSAYSFEPPFEVNAAEVYMVNLDTGIVVYEKDATTPRSPASITKMMTALLFIEAIGAENLSTTMITAPGYIYDELYGTGSSSADVRPYETLTAEDVLYGMMLPSGNECASIAADYVGKGNINSFLFMMNSKAKALGCENTNFTNPHGLWSMEEGNHYSCAKDMYLIARECYKNETFMKVVTTTSYTRAPNNKHTEPVTVYNTNYMQNSTSTVYRSYIRGLKTGSTPDAGYNLVSSATLEGENYLLVVMGTPYEKDENGQGLAFSVTASLYDWAFDYLNVAPAIDTTSPAEEVTVKYSTETDNVKVYPKESFYTLLPSDTNESIVQKTFHLPEYVSAPVKEGDVMGYVALSLSGEDIGYVELISGESVQRNTLLYIVSNIIEFISSTYFKVVIVLSILTFIGYLAYCYYLRRKYYMSRRVNRKH